MKKTLNIILIIAIVLALGSAIWSWFKPPRIIEKWETIEVPKEIIKIKKVEVPGPERIKVITKKEVVKVFKLPEWIEKDEAEQIIAAGKAPCGDAKLSIICLLNVETGEGKIVQKLNRRSFFGFPNERTIGAQYGIRQIAEVRGEYKFFRIASFKLGIYGKVDQDGEADAGGIISYEF